MLLTLYCMHQLFWTPKMHNLLHSPSLLDKLCWFSNIKLSTGISRVLSLQECAACDDCLAKHSGWRSPLLALSVGWPWEIQDTAAFLAPCQGQRDCCRQRWRQAAWCPPAWHTIPFHFPTRLCPMPLQFWDFHFNFHQLVGTCLWNLALSQPNWGHMLTLTDIVLIYGTLVTPSHGSP